MNRRPMHNNNNNRPNNNGGGNNGGGNNHRFRRNGNNQRGRPGGGLDYEQEGDFVSPQQRRHAQNQQAKYQDLARNARQSGDRVETEYYLQHVEHYTRVIHLSDAQQREKDEVRGASHSRHNPRDDAEENAHGTTGESAAEEHSAPVRQHYQQPRQHPAGRNDHYEQRPARTHERRPESGASTDEAHETSSESSHQEGNEQRRRLRPFRQPREPFAERSAPREDLFTESAPSDRENAAVPIAGDAQETAPARRGRPRKALKPESGEGTENHGMTLAGVLPKADF